MVRPRTKMVFHSADIFSCTTEQFNDPLPYIISCSKQSAHHGSSVRLSSGTIVVLYYIVYGSHVRNSLYNNVHYIRVVMCVNAM